MRYSLTPTAQPAEELFTSSIKEVNEITKTAKHFTRQQFKLNVQPGDVVIAYCRHSKVKWWQKITKFLTTTAQGSSFSSCKLVGKEAKEIIGYEASLKSLTLNTSPCDKFMSEYEIALILRHKNATEDQLKKVVDYIYDKKNKKIPYAFGKVFISVFKHLFASEVNEPEKQGSDADAGVTTIETSSKKVEAPKPEQEYTLFCSSVVHLAYQSAGIAIKYKTDIEDDYVWPRDLLLSKSFEVVGGWFSKEAGVKAPK